MKQLYFVVWIALALCFHNFKVSAQGGVPTAYRGDYNRMMTNMSMNNAMNFNMSMMMNQRWYKSMGYLQNSKYTFKVTLKDSSLLEITSKIYADTVLHKSYLIYTDKSLKRSDPGRERKIYSDQTVKLYRVESAQYGGHHIEGFATDSCWLFKVVQGRINAYSHLSEATYIDSYYLRAFQVGEGPVQKMDSTALIAVIKEDPKAMKAFLKRDYYKAIDKYNHEKIKQ